MNDDYEIAKFQLCRDVCKMVKDFISQWGKDQATLELQTADGDAILTSDGRNCKGKIFVCKIDAYNDDDELNDEKQ